MSSPLESFCAETGSSTGLFHTREDFSLKNIQKMDVTADSCILELCCALHLNQAVQEFIAYNPFVESYKNVPLIRLICVTLRDVVLNKRLMNYPLAIELLESVPGLCPQIDFDFQFGSLLVDMKSQVCELLVYKIHLHIISFGNFTTSSICGLCGCVLFMDTVRPLSSDTSIIRHSL
jgi:hypothetical protein